MPALHRPAPPERPDPVVLLIDAVINRQADLAQRLAQQWIHRHGLAAFTSLGTTRLQQLCGDDGLCWLQEQLGLHSGQRQSPEPGSSDRPDTHPPALTPPVPLGRLLREALNEALQPLRLDSGGADGQRPTADPAAADCWSLPTLTARDGTQQNATTAPAPADLAALRAWLHNDAA